MYLTNLSSSSHEYNTPAIPPPTIRFHFNPCDYFSSRLITVVYLLPQFNSQLVFNYINSDTHFVVLLLPGAIVH